MDISQFKFHHTEVYYSYKEEAKYVTYKNGNCL